MAASLLRYCAKANWCKDQDFMALQASSKSSVDDCSDGPWREHEEQKRLLSPEILETPPTCRRHHHLLFGLVMGNIFLTIVTILLAVALSIAASQDPSLTVYSPAKEAVRYYVHRFRPALGNETEYMGFPTDETDQRWEALYQYNASVISETQARRLLTPTMAIPGTKRYLVELEVFHNLHCLNELRKLLWPERYRLLEQLTSENGTIDRSSFGFKHWGEIISAGRPSMRLTRKDHCVDSLRQALMCNADISPISWHVNVPFNRGIYPRLATTHTCKDFSQIQKWAAEHHAPSFEQRIYDFEELQRVIDDTDIDHSTEEDLQNQYWLFPGDKWFKHWREHTYHGEVSRPQIYPTSRHEWED
ncbi:Cyclochlorotine biosynthesis protein O [Fulvia fulva]|uniref:Cyclochlorotine biosynthesis protein O n=1 Tax=Passalora fulva TaxID=5499 RepID=A0A9Q8USE1_PASFU|nr:Cyclochlorotine biosynthesis protein O [Fulvia fulva]UJO20680.1 Cyclochlorotine biosynthesis protein O [Fulvia fulva]WPV18345.1 Cyclochlorotine biosynthesis protein O [Fulvia fulva]WPV32956.1 Cyclochlorotine biosynthesis protein O [Fulvia fulva]